MVNRVARPEALSITTGASTSSATSAATTTTTTENGAHVRSNPYALVDDDGSKGPGSGKADNDSSWAGFDDFEGFPWWKIPSVYWLVGPFFLFTLAFGGSIVPKLNLIVDLICNHHFSPSTPDAPGLTHAQCKTPEVQQLVAQFTLILNMIIGLLSGLTAPKLGALSDRHGRKRIMVISSMGGILSEIIVIFAAKYPAQVPYKWMILGAVFDGLGGSFTAGTVLSHSYTSDCTPPSKRGVAIGYLHACIFTGLALGPLLAGYFAKATGSLLSVFYVTLGCHIFFIVFVLLVTPESLSRKKQLLAREKYAKEQAALADRGWFVRIMGGSANPLAPLEILVPRGKENSGLRRNLMALAWCDFVMLGGAMAAGTVVLLYSELTFGWDTLETSQFVSAISAVRVAVLMLVFPVVTWLFRTRPMRRKREEALGVVRKSRAANGVNGNGDGMNANGVVSNGDGRLAEEEPLIWSSSSEDETQLAAAHATLASETNAGADMLDIWLIRMAIFSDMLGSLGYLFARTPALFVLSGVVTAFGGIGSATIQAAVTKHVPSQRVGQLLGAMGLLHALARVVGPILFNGLYAATVKTFPQALFVLMAGMFLVALVASGFLRPDVFMPDVEEDSERDAGDAMRPLLNPATPTADTLAEEELLPA